MAGLNKNYENRGTSIKHQLKNNIRRLRFDNGQMTQQDLADKVGVTRQTIIAIEQNKYSPSLGLAFKIAREFNSKVEDVFQYVNEK